MRVRAVPVVRSRHECSDAVFGIQKAESKAEESDKRLYGTWMLMLFAFLFCHLEFFFKFDFVQRTKTIESERCTSFAAAVQVFEPFKRFVFSVTAADDDVHRRAAGYESEFKKKIQL